MIYGNGLLTVKNEGSHRAVTTVTKRAVVVCLHCRKRSELCIKIRFGKYDLNLKVFELYCENWNS